MPRGAKKGRCKEIGIDTLAARRDRADLIQVNGELEQRCLLHKGKSGNTDIKTRSGYDEFNKLN